MADRLLTARLPPCIPHTDRLRMVMPAPIFLTWPYDRYARRLPSCARRTSLLTIASKRQGQSMGARRRWATVSRHPRPEERA